MGPDRTRARPRRRSRGRGLAARAAGLCSSVPRRIQATGWSGSKVSASRRRRSASTGRPACCLHEADVQDELGAQRRQGDGHPRRARPRSAPGPRRSGGPRPAPSRGRRAGRRYPGPPRRRGARAPRSRARPQVVAEERRQPDEQQERGDQREAARGVWLSVAPASRQARHPQGSPAPATIAQPNQGQVGVAIGRDVRRAVAEDARPRE